LAGLGIVQPDAGGSQVLCSIRPCPTCISLSSYSRKSPMRHHVESCSRTRRSKLQIKGAVYISQLSDELRRIEQQQIGRTKGPGLLAQENVRINGLVLLVTHVVGKGSYYIIQRYATYNFIFARKVTFTNKVEVELGLYGAIVNVKKAFKNFS